MSRVRRVTSTRGALRRALVPAAASIGSFAGLNPDGTFDLVQVLAWLGSTAGAGAAVYFVIEFSEKWLRRPFDPNFKFYAAGVLSFVIPVGAYLLTVWMGQQWSFALLAAAIGVGYYTSQTVHFETVPPPKPELSTGGV